MIDDRQVRAAEERFKDQTQRRESARGLIKAGAILSADAPDRVAKRLRRIGCGEAEIAEMLGAAEPLGAPAPGAPPAPTARTATAVAANPALERILHTNDLMPIRFLEAGANAARSVGRVLISDRPEVLIGYGTGCLVSAQLLLTNNHVLESAAIASFSQVQLDYQEGIDGNERSGVVFDLDPEIFFITDPHLDYTLVAVKPQSRSGVPLSDFGLVPVIESEGKVIMGEFLNIIQHPSGELKQIALRQNALVDVLEDFLHYETDTAPGSSGAPVFSDAWELVALHHSGVPERDGDDNILSLDGGIWTPEMGEHKIKWIANEGARISRIARHLRTQDTLTAAQQALRDALLAGGLETSTAVRPLVSVTNSRPKTSAGVSSSRVNSPLLQKAQAQAQAQGPEAVWTIPLQVRVSIGTPIAGDAIAPVSVDAISAVNGATVSTTGATTPTELDEPVELDRAALDEALREYERHQDEEYYDEETDAHDRETYYAGVEVTGDGERWFARLSRLLENTHRDEISYKPSLHLYPWVDLQENRMLRSIYTGQEFTAEDFIREDLRLERRRDAQMAELLRNERFASKADQREYLDFLEATLPFNCEHVVPQSWFDKRQPMRGDLHHLFACQSQCNSFRGNIPYFDFEDFEEVVRVGCGKREDDRFEPKDGKGPAARATMYFLLRYPGQIDDRDGEFRADRLDILLRWHEQFPVTRYERHRNTAIAAVQGNRNPLIDFPEWADRIDFKHGLGV